MTRILVVDDSAMDRRIAGGLLERHDGWRVDYANDGQQALDAVAARPPDLILTDMQMPELNGLELVEAINRDYPLVPVILMTAQGNERLAVQALEHGAASYVPKKLLAQDLVEMVERVLALAGQKRTSKELLRSMQSLACQFVLANEPAVLTTLVGYLQGLVHDMGLFTESERLRVGVALEEALLNAAYHGNLEVSSKLRETDHSAYYDLARQRVRQSPYRDRRIHVEAFLSTDSGLRYVIRDEGPGFDPACLPDPTNPENLERPCGRGLLLMRTFMDGVHYNDCGNQVTLVKKSATPAPTAVAS